MMKTSTVKDVSNEPLSLLSDEQNRTMTLKEDEGLFI